jgi:hypothetical protein
VGEWKNARKHGLGLEIYPSGEKYEGHFENGKKEGNGTYHWPTGDTYVGAFNSGKRNGPGYYRQANGTKTETYFNNGQSLSDICIQKGLVVQTTEHDRCVLEIVRSMEF